MTRVGLGLGIGLGIAAVSLTALGLLATLRRAAPPPGPDPVPLGATVERTLPDAEGRPETWRITKRSVPREELSAQLLPAPAPRETPPDARTDSARALDARALEAWRHGEMREALDLFEAAVAADPDDGLPRANYGRLLVLMTDYAAARAQLERAAELRADDPRVWLDLASLYERSLLLERAWHARSRAEELAGTRGIARDPTGLWVLEGENIFP